MSAVTQAVAPVARALETLRERRPAWYRLLRYGVVSVVITPVTLALLYVMHSVAGWQPWQANLLAVSTGAVPAYLIDRYWVWNRSGRSRLWGEVMPFWAVTVVGAAASTVAVEAAGRWDNSVLLVAVNLGTYAALWLVKFLFLDRVLWPTGSPPFQEEVRRTAGVADT